MSRPAFLVLSILFGTTAAAMPAVSFQGRAITVSGVSLRARVYVFGVARELHGDYSSVIQRETVLSDDDGDGVVAWQLPIDVPHRSIWLAVDLQTNAAVAATPPGYAAARIELSGEHLKKDGSQAIAQISAPGALIEVVVVRANAGIWRGTVAWRGAGDEGKDPKKVTVSTTSLQPQQGTTDPAPKHLKKGDVVFFLESSRAMYGIATVGD
jgi:hypothetical protein